MIKFCLTACLFVLASFTNTGIANEINPIIDFSGLAVMDERPQSLNNEPSVLASVNESETITVDEPTPAYEDVWVTEYQQVCFNGQCFQQPVRRLVRRAVQPAMTVASKSIDVVQTVAAAPLYAMETVFESVSYRSDVAYGERRFQPFKRFRNRMAGFHQRRAMRLSR